MHEYTYILSAHHLPHEWNIWWLHKLARKQFGYKGYWRRLDTNEISLFYAGECLACWGIWLFILGINIGVQFYFVHVVVEDGKVDMPKIHTRIEYMFD